MIDAGQAQRNGFRRELLGKVGRDRHPMIRGVAAVSQKLIYDFLRYKKSGRCLRTLRFKRINDLNLFAFRWDKEAHLLRHRGIIRQL